LSVRVWFSGFTIVITGKNIAAKIDTITTAQQIIMILGAFCLDNFINTPLN
jgi:hypothetical protein